MVGFFLFLFLASETFSLELLDRCEIEYRRCAFECLQKFLLDKERRSGCEMRCKFDKGVCDIREGVRKTIKNMEKFLKGFSQDR